MVCTTLLLEGTGFELPVPRAMQGRPKAIIDGFGCMPPSLDYLRLPLVEISEGGPKRNLGTEALSREEPEVRIHLPPPASQLRTWAFRAAYGETPSTPKMRCVAYLSPTATAFL